MTGTPEEQLMTALYEEHGAVLFAFVLRYVDDRAHAEDVVQETLLRAWRHLDRPLYYDGRTVDEAAALLQIPPGTVKPRSYYAIRALRTVFEEMGVLR